MNRKSRIGLAKTPPQPSRKDIETAVREAVKLAGGLPPAIKKSATVLLKPNLVDIPKSKYSGAVTNPEVCRAVALMVMEEGAVPVIADSAGVGVNTEDVIEFMGYNKLRKDGFRVLDLKKEPVTPVIMPPNCNFNRMRVFKPALDADAIINLPVLKTHDQIEITVSLKNLKGLLDDITKKKMHRKGIVKGIVEAASYFKPCLTIVDGIYAQEGLGPVYGDPVEMDLIIAGADMVAIDAVAGLIMGYQPEEVPVTKEAASIKMGCAQLEEIEVRGISWEEVARPFKRACQADIIYKELPCSLYWGEETCTGCRNTVIAVLVEMKEFDLWDFLSQKTLVTGCPEFIAEEVGKIDGLYLIGNCSARLKKERGYFIPGCPPENSWIVDALVLGERKKQPEE